MPQPKFPISKIDQVCIVVKDLDATVRRYWAELGIGPWRIYTYGPGVLKYMTLDGRPAEYRMRVALTTVGPLIYEIIQPLSDNTIYSRFLRERGEGLHHLGIIVDDLETAAPELERLGYRMIQSGGGHGKHGDGGFAYFGTEDGLATIIELITLPKERIAPEAVYPPEPS